MTPPSERTTADAVATVKEVYGERATLLGVDRQTLEVKRLEFQMWGGLPKLVVLRDTATGSELSGFQCPCCTHVNPILVPPQFLHGPEGGPDAQEG
jgi:hypothetical protein